MGSPGDGCRWSWSPVSLPCDPALRSLTNQQSCPSQQQSEQQQAQRPDPSCQKDRILGVAQPALPSTYLYWWAGGTAVASWALLPKGKSSRRWEGTSSCRLGPLGGHSQPCCSSSSQTMRVIFSQRFNTSQLARVQGGSPPPSPPRQQSLAPPTAYAQAASASLFISFPRSSSWCPAAPPTRVKL